ncbi:MAG: M48 family metallopeptidase [Myxococcota bacterium]
MRILLRATLWSLGGLAAAAAIFLISDYPLDQFSGLQSELAAADEASAPVPVPEPSEKTMRYYRSGNVLWVVSVLWGLLVPAVILLVGLSARLRDLASTIGRRWFFIIAAYWVLLSLLTYIVDLPLSYYAGFVRQHAYDLSNQTFAKWIGDSLKSLGVGVVGGVLVLWGPYLALRKSPRRWWLYTGVISVPFFFLVFLIQPVWIAPLFNDFSLLSDQALESEILALAERAGIEGSRVFEVNKSVDTVAVNAYVSGFLNTKRIVLWDTIIARLDRPELLFVMAHEMGHYVLNHIIKLVLLNSLVVLLGLYLIHRSAGLLIERFRRRFGFERLDDVASLPLILLLANVFLLALAPVTLATSRYFEHEADRFGLELVQTSRAAATAFVKLSDQNLGNPRPGLLFRLWRSSHPPLGERIEFANEYRPWRSAEALTYGDRFGPPPE